MTLAGIEATSPAWLCLAHEMRSWLDSGAGSCPVQVNRPTNPERALLQDLKFSSRGVLQPPGSSTKHNPESRNTRQREQAGVRFRNGDWS